MSMASGFWGCHKADIFVEFVIFRPEVFGGISYLEVFCEDFKKRRRPVCSPDHACCMRR